MDRVEGFTMENSEYIDLTTGFDSDDDDSDDDDNDEKFMTGPQNLFSKVHGMLETQSKKRRLAPDNGKNENLNDATAASSSSPPQTLPQETRQRPQDQANWEVIRQLNESHAENHNLKKEVSQMKGRIRELETDLGSKDDDLKKALHDGKEWKEQMERFGEEILRLNEKEGTNYKIMAEDNYKVAMDRREAWRKYHSTRKELDEKRKSEAAMRRELRRMYKVLRKASPETFEMETTGDRNGMFLDILLED
ncbi:hypothetical protein PFICI_02393 [Pestalotiopsis fici W106-1]|uniref:Uncharacterized protein n=1 Tax=Pestalotiopsis fici (strain W106-1 / CGMCC3.15140) TaxID=1229662 RepID=W3XE50_PESFW|nr:uncharacterized protein PFICI_02393 [Pestalotiopsis fici W106-1]ETS84368.1 hypothetical protein PFICI_02393 [Pestalotiopsis fici W106-1]